MDTKHRFPVAASSQPTTIHSAQTLLLFALFAPFQVLAINRILNTSLQARKFHEVESAQKRLGTYRRLRLISDFRYLCEATGGKQAGAKMKALYLGFVPYSLLYLAAASLQPKLFENGSTDDSIFHPIVDQRKSWTPGMLATGSPDNQSSPLPRANWAANYQGITYAVGLNYLAVLALRMSSMESPHKGQLLRSVKSLLTTSPFRAAFCGLLPLLAAS
mmetsp:Transcript_21385/g.33072  ORF Transcript_21385/g.33072 Transcript_21385/m.33072 type:complete len:218 (+) Transcript_21385:14-667(+)